MSPHIIFVQYFIYLFIEGCENVKSLPEGIMRNCNLEQLNIFGCSSLTSFPSGELPSTLEHLDISNCGNLELLPDHMPNLIFLAIEGCKGLKHHHVQNLTSLEYLTIRGCPSLESFPEQGLGFASVRLGTQLAPLSQKSHHCSRWISKCGFIFTWSWWLPPSSSYISHQSLHWKFPESGIHGLDVSPDPHFPWRSLYLGLSKAPAIFAKGRAAGNTRTASDPALSYHRKEVLKGRRRRLVPHCAHPCIVIGRNWDLHSIFSLQNKWEQTLFNQVLPILNAQQKILLFQFLITNVTAISNFPAILFIL